MTLYISSHLLEDEIKSNATAKNLNRWNIAHDRRISVPDHLKADVRWDSVAEETSTLVKVLAGKESARNRALLAQNRLNGAKYWDAIQKHRHKVQEKRSNISNSDSQSHLPPPLQPTQTSCIMSSAKLPRHLQDCVLKDAEHAFNSAVPKRGRSIVKVCGAKESNAKNKRAQRKQQSASILAYEFEPYSAPAPRYEVICLDNDDDDAIVEPCVPATAVAGIGGDCVNSTEPLPSTIESSSSTEIVKSGKSDAKDRNSRPSMIIPCVEVLPRSVAWIRIKGKSIEGVENKELRFLPYFEDDVWNDERLETAIGEHFDKVVGEIELDICHEALEAAIIWFNEKYWDHDEAAVPKITSPTKAIERRPYKFGTSISRTAGSSGTSELIDLTESPSDDEEGNDSNSNSHGNGNGNGSVQKDDEEESAPVEVPVSKHIRTVCDLLQITTTQLMSTVLRLSSQNKYLSSDPVLIEEYKKSRVARYGNDEFLALLPLGLVPALYRNSSVNPLGMGLKNHPAFDKIVENYHDLFCRLCYKYDCELHGMYQPTPRKIVTYQPLPNPIPDMHQDEADVALMNADLIKASKITSARIKRALNADQGGRIKPPPKAGRLDFFCGDKVGTSRKDTVARGVLPLNIPSNSARAKELISSSYAGIEGDDIVLDPMRLAPNLYASILADSACNDDKLTESEKALLGKLVSRYGDDIETISRLLGTRPTHVVKSYMQSAGLIDSMCRPCDPFYTSLKRISAYNIDRKVNVHHKKPIRHFIPCNHEGECSKSTGCVCFANKMFCEKYCGCDVNCKHKFKGCKCTQVCVTKVCPCVAANRECDPDLCGRCGASSCPDFLPDTERYVHSVGLEGAIKQASFRNLKEKVRGCKNTAMRRGAEKRTYVSHSKVHGWGLFVLEPAKKGDFILEYLGEVISQAETDRRGVIYDRQGLSYIFNINEDACVDATRVGNNAKFINHALGDLSNLEPKIFMIDGCHRVGFFAKRPLKANEELSFDYSYTEEMASNSGKWAMKTAWIKKEAKLAGEEEERKRKEKDSNSSSSSRKKAKYAK